MITIDGNKIKISKGDTFDVTFRLNGYQIDSNDKIVFSVKDRFGNGRTLISKTLTGITGTDINVNIPAEEMKLESGIKYYDILLVNSSGKFTLMYPAILEIVEVVHNE
jgi:hypothetical protein